MYSQITQRPVGLPEGSLQMHTGIFLRHLDDRQTLKVEAKATAMKLL